MQLESHTVMIIEELVTITSLTNQVGTKIGQILAPQWAAVVNIYRSGLVSGATPYPSNIDPLWDNVIFSAGTDEILSFDFIII